MTDIGKRVRIARGEMTQNELREKVGLKTLMAISNIETGVTLAPKMETLQKIADATGRSLQWILYGDERPEETLDTSTAQAEQHPVLETLLREHPELDPAVVAQLRTTYHRGADDDFVRETFTKAILKAQRAAEGRVLKVDDKGQVAKPERQRGRKLGAATEKPKGGI